MTTFPEGACNVSIVLLDTSLDGGWAGNAQPSFHRCPYLHLTIPIFLWVFAVLAFLAQFLELCLTLLDRLHFGAVLALVFFQGGLGG